MTVHPVLEGIQEHFGKGRITESGYLRPAKQTMADIFVPRNSVPRAIEAASELFLLLEHHGHRVVLAPRDVAYVRVGLDHRGSGGRELQPSETWSPGRPTIVFIGGVAFGLTLFELAEEVEMKYVNGKYVPLAEIPIPKRPPRYPEDSWTTKRERPTGRLCVRAYSPYRLATWTQRWCEKTPGDLPTSFPDIERTLAREAPTLARLVEEGERQAEEQRKVWEAEHRQWLKEESARRVTLALKESREEFLQIVDRWARARWLEDFFEDARKRAAALEGDELASVLGRLERARILFGGLNSLEHFRSWRTPEDRYRPDDPDEGPEE